MQELAPLRLDAELEGRSAARPRNQQLRVALLHSCASARSGSGAMAQRFDFPRWCFLPPGGLRRLLPRAQNRRRGRVAPVARRPFWAAATRAGPHCRCGDAVERGIIARKLLCAKTDSLPARGGLVAASKLAGGSTPIVGFDGAPPRCVPARRRAGSEWTWRWRCEEVVGAAGGDGDRRFSACRAERTADHTVGGRGGSRLHSMASDCSGGGGGGGGGGLGGRSGRLASRGGPLTITDAPVLGACSRRPFAVFARRE